MADREKLIELLEDVQRCGEDYTDYEIYGMRIPDTVSNEEVASHLISHGVTVHERGRWEQVDHDGSWRVDRCSICHRRMHYVDYDQPYQYCPLCGAKMDEERRKGE